MSLNKEQVRAAIKFAAEVSARAQRLATAEQETEFKQLLRDKCPDLKCIGCGKVVEYTNWGDDDYQDGYYYGGSLMIDTFGYGSTKHDMSKVAVLVCDDCAETKGVTSNWLDKLHRHFEAEKDNPTEPFTDYQI